MWGLRDTRSFNPLGDEGKEARAQHLPPLDAEVLELARPLRFGLLSYRVYTSKINEDTSKLSTGWNKLT